MSACDASNRDAALIGNSRSVRVRMGCVGRCVALGGLFAWLTIIATSAQVQALAAPTLEVEGDGAAGHLRASWNSMSSTMTYELQQSESATFEGAETRYRGPHNASVLSGLPDGTLHLRVRAISDHQQGPWSKPQTFVVHHHSRALALGFLLAGALVFVATLSFLLFFAKRHSHD